MRRRLIRSFLTGAALVSVLSIFGQARASSEALPYDPSAFASVIQSQASAARSMASGTCGCTTCRVEIPRHHQRIRDTVTEDFLNLEAWSVGLLWRENILPALMEMAGQLSVAGLYQTEIFGSFLDAKHQLETQRLFQRLKARAHKDYHPSAGMCTFGTVTRSLAASERKGDLARLAVANQMQGRAVLRVDTAGAQGADSDRRGRLQTYIANFCDQGDNGNGLTYLCPEPVPNPAQRNIDIDYTRNIEARLTLDADFTGDQTEQQTDDEAAVFALASNLYAHELPPVIEANLFGGNRTEEVDGVVYERGYGVRIAPAQRYMDLRALFAKRSVAQNSFANIAGMRAAGTPEAAPYVKAAMRGLGVEDSAEISQMMGKNPSYFAQMEVLTKKLYQNPVFYTELYDNPANVARKGAALQAFGLMQDRDTFNSLLRSEMVLSIILETEIERKAEEEANRQRKARR